MHNLTAAAAAGAGLAATAEGSAAAVAVGEALRTIRERVRATALRCGNDSHGASSNSSGSTSSGNSSRSSKESSPSSSCSSASTSSLTSTTAARAGVRVRLVAVSKHQTAAAVAAAAAAGQRHFAENYVQELISKSGELKQLNLSWHMIGHLQSNKAKQLLAACPDLYMVETVDSIRLAHILDDAVAAVMSQRAYKPLRVLVQVNTSGEDSKSGLRLAPKETTGGAEKDGASPSRGQQQHEKQHDALHQKQQEEQRQSQQTQRQEQQLGELQALVQCIVKECSHLRFAGLMTIGPPNIPGARQAFAELARIKEQLLSSLPAVRALFKFPLGPSGGLLSPLRDEEMREASARRPLDDYLVDEKEGMFELSMGMTSDFEEAIQAGSTEVRVGTAIFGQRC